MSDLLVPVYRSLANSADADLFIFSEHATGTLEGSLAQTYGSRIRSFDNLSDCVSEAMDGHAALVALDVRSCNSVLATQVQRLRNEGASSGTAVILRVENLSAGDLYRLVLCGANDVITSSLSQYEVMNRIANLLEGSASAPKLSGSGVMADVRLSKAHDVENLLPGPDIIERMRSDYRVDIDGLYLSRQEAGGDLWGILPIDNTTFAVYTADFCGHSFAVVPHAIRLASLMGTQGPDYRKPEDVLAWVNNRLRAFLPVGQFAAMAYALVSLDRNLVTIASSAHMPALIRPDASGKFHIAETSGLPLGMVGGATYDTLDLPFAPGGQMLLYSDALVETPLPKGGCLTPQRLASFCDAHPPATAKGINRSLLQVLGLNGKAADDDLTIVTLRRH